MTYDDYVQSGLNSYQILGAYPTGPQYDESGAPIDTSNQVAMRWPDETGALNELRRRNGIPDQYSNDQIKQWAQAVIPTMPENHGQSFGSQLMDFAGPGSPMAWMASMALGGPVAGTISAANGSGATQSLGVDPRLTTAAGLAYGAYNSNPLGSTPDASVAGSEYGVSNESPINGPTGSGGGNGGVMGDETGAFDMGGSQGVFDQSGNPLYSSPGGLFGTGSGILGSNISGQNILDFLGKNKGLLGAGLGALLGGASGGAKPAGNVTTTQGPPDWLMPYIQGNIGAGQNILSGMQSNQPLLNSAQNQVQKTINGDYLDPSTNPYLAQSANDALGLAKSQFNSQYTGAFGDANNANMQEGLARNLGNTALPFYMNNYNTARGQQLSTALQAPAMSAQSSEAAFSPIKAFSGLFPNASATTQPYFQNQLGSALSGGLFGGALGKAFG